VIQRSGAGGSGVGVGVGGDGVHHSAQLDLVMVASNLGPPILSHVVEEMQEPPDGLNGTSDVGVGKPLSFTAPQLTHCVVVLQTASRGPPLHSLMVVSETHASPGAGVKVGFAVMEAGIEKSGGVPVGFGTQ
jgi:hypothetical protein